MLVNARICLFPSIYVCMCVSYHASGLVGVPASLTVSRSLVHVGTSMQRSNSINIGEEVACPDAAFALLVSAEKDGSGTFEDHLLGCEHSEFIVF